MSMSEIDSVGYMVVIYSWVEVEIVRVVVRVVHMIVTIEKPVEVIIWIVVDGTVVIVPVRPVKSS